MGIRLALQGGFHPPWIRNRRAACGGTAVSIPPSRPHGGRAAAAGRGVLPGMNPCKTDFNRNKSPDAQHPGTCLWIKGTFNFSKLPLGLHPVFNIPAVTADKACHGDPLYCDRLCDADAVGQIAVRVIWNTDNIMGAAFRTDVGVLHRCALNTTAFGTAARTGGPTRRSAPPPRGAVRRSKRAENGPDRPRPPQRCPRLRPRRTPGR